MEPNYDVYVLNFKTLVWSTIEIKTHLGKSAKLVHGHSLVTTYDEGIIYLFGGKDVVDGKKAVLESVVAAKRLMRRKTVLTLGNQLKTAIMSPINKESASEMRFDHIAVSGAKKGYSYLAIRHQSASRRPRGTFDVHLWWSQNRDFRLL